MSRQLDTSDREGVGEAEDLGVWLKKNKLMKARPKLIENDATLQELKELADESSTNELKIYAQNELCLDLLTAKRFAKSVVSLTSNPSHSPPKPTDTVIRIVVTVEEERAINKMHKRQTSVNEKINIASNNINTLNKLAEMNENEVNEFRKQAMLRLNQRMDAIIVKSNGEINKKKAALSSHINTLKAYHKSLTNARSRSDHLLNDQNADKTKRKLQIVNIAENVLKAEAKELNITANVKVEINRDGVLRYFDDIGMVNNYSFPAKPNISVYDIKETLVTIRFNNIQCGYGCLVELCGNYEGDDEKKMDGHEWKQVCLLQNESEYKMKELADNTVYVVRAKYKNKHGYGQFCDAVTVKTKKVHLQSSILTAAEIKSFLALLSQNGKKLGKSWNLIYRAKTDGLNMRTFVDKVHGIPNVMCFIHTQGNNVCGGYTSTGWQKGKTAGHSADDKAFVFGIRSSKKYAPVISNVKANNSNQALGYCHYEYCCFGDNYLLYIYQDVKLYQENPSYYDSFPNDYHLLGGNGMDVISDIEVFQLR